MSDAKLPVLRSVMAAYAFFIANWRPILIAGLPYTAAYAVQLWLLLGGAPEGVTTALGPLVWLIALFASVALSAAALRMAIRGDYSGWLGLKLGRDEMRVFIASVLVSLLLIIVFTLVFLFWGTIFGTVAMGALERSGIDPESAGMELAQAVSVMSMADTIAVVLAGIGCGAIVLWMAARLSLALPATIALEKVQVMKAWPLSGGSGWRIAAALLLAGLPLIVLELGLYELMSQVRGERLFDVSGLLDAESAALPGIALMREYGLWMSLFSAINIPVFSGLYAYMYRNRTKTPEAA